MSEYLPQADPIDRLPIAVLMIKSSCNCRCSMCDIWLDTKRQELSEISISTLLPQLKALGTRELVLSGGEPLMHSAIESIGRAVKSGNIKLTLLTTGLLLKRHAAWVSECVDQTYVSLDGPEAIHNEIRNIPDAFRKIAAGIRAVRECDPDKAIGARSTVHRQNFKYLSQTVDATRELGLDSISFLAADVDAGNFGRADDWLDKGLALLPEQLPELRTALDLLCSTHAEYFDSGFIVESRHKLERNLYQYYEALSGQGRAVAPRCNAPWVSTVIETDGRVRPCFFHQPFSGNVTQQPLANIINSDSARTWRRNLDVQTNPVCRSCVCSLALAN